MELTHSGWLCNAGGRTRRKLLALILLTGVLWVARTERASAVVTTTTVQGTVYLANGQPGSGMLHVSWPGFTSANGQAIVADSVDVTIGGDGFLSVNLAANQGAMPAGLFYTAVFYMSDGSVSTQYWVVPAAAQASLAQVQAQVMPAAQAVQAVSKVYVDQAIAQLSQSVLTGSGGTLTGPLYLNDDPTQPLQAADKHYVDLVVRQSGSSDVDPASPGQIAYYSDNGTSLKGLNTVPVTAGGTGSATSAGALESLGGISMNALTPQTMAGPLTGPKLGAIYQADQFAGADASVKINACITAVISAGGGTCDASGLSGAQTVSEQINVGTPAQAASAGVSVTLVLPTSALWTVTIADGTSCAIKQYSSTTIMRLGEAGGGGGNRMLLVPNSSTRISSYYCTDPDASYAGGGSYIRVGGFWVGDNTTTSRTGPIFKIQKLFDESHLHDMGADVGYGDVWEVGTTCCGTSFEHIQGFAGDTTTGGGYPLHLLTGNQAISFRDSTFNGPGAGKNNILIDVGNYNVSFDNVYEERYADDTTPANKVASGSDDISFTHTTVSAEPSAYCWENSAPSGFSVRDSFCPTGGGAINDLAFGKTVPAAYTPINYSSTATKDIHLQASTDEQFLMTPNQQHIPVAVAATSFTPTTIGWYRIQGGSNCQSSSGTVLISGAYDNAVSDLAIDYMIRQFGGSSLLTARTLGQYGGSWGVIDKIEASSDGASNTYLDIHIGTATTPSPISVVFTGQGTCKLNLVSSPVVGAVPGASTVSLIDFSVVPAGTSFVTTGNVVYGSGHETPLAVVASGTLALATSAIASGACQTVTAGSINSAAAAGVLSTDTITFTPNGSIKAVTGYTPGTSGGLTIAAYPTVGYVNFDVCNWSASSITPGAVTLNWEVTR
jgi:hypothetical protein